MAHGSYPGAGATLRNTVMDLRMLSLSAVICAVIGFAACGDGAGDTDPTTDPASSATVNQGDFGPAPKLGGNITAHSPAYAQRVKQAATRSPDPSRPKELCAEVNFEDLAGQDTLRWFRIAYDNAEVTGEHTWIVAPDENDRSGGTVCFAPEEGLTVGKHTAAISVEDPNNPAAPRKQIVSWAFEVIE